MTALTDEKLAEIEKRHEEAGQNPEMLFPSDLLVAADEDRATLLAEVKRQVVDIQVLLAALKEIARGDSPFSAQAIATAALSAKDKA